MEVIAHVGRAVHAGDGAAGPRGRGQRARTPLMAVAPYYYAHDADALLAHYRALLAALGDTPVLAYTFPDRTGNELEPEVLDTLAGRGARRAQGLDRVARAPRRVPRGGGAATRASGSSSGSEALMLEAHARRRRAGSISALANARADVLLALREEGSEEAQQAVDRAKRGAARHRRGQACGGASAWPSAARSIRPSRGRRCVDV